MFSLLDAGPEHRSMGGRIDQTESPHGLANWRILYYIVL